MTGQYYCKDCKKYHDFSVTRTGNQTIWAASKNHNSKLAQVRALEKEFKEIKKLAQNLIDSGEIANMEFDFGDDDEEKDLLEDEQAVLSASKDFLDFDNTIELFSRKRPEKIDADDFNHYMDTNKPGKRAKSASSNYHVLGYHQPNRTNSGDKFLIEMGGTIEPSKETRRAAVNPTKSSDDFLKKLGGD